MTISSFAKPGTFERLAVRLERSNKPTMVLVLCMLVSCGSPSIFVPKGPHVIEVEKQPVQIPTPPPTTQIEVVPLRRNLECYYLDGYHRPQGGGWTWEKGMWVLPPPNCYYAPPTTGYEKLENGTTLVYRPGVWLTKGAKPSLCQEPLPCPEAK